MRPDVDERAQRFMATRQTTTGRLGRLLLAGLFAASALVTSTVEAAPARVRLSYTGPTDTTMTVAWNTTSDVGTEVRYGTTSGNLTDTVSGTSFAASGALGYVHEVNLTGLAPDTLYYYQAGDASDGYSTEYFFTTGPAPDEHCGNFSFVFLGDNRPDPIFGGGDTYDVILGQAVTHQPAFLLNGGDLVIDGDQIDQWIDYLGYNESEVAYLPNMPCLGNHDTGPGEGDGAIYNQLFALPVSTGTYGSGTEDYYFFTYANAIFVALSTDTFKDGATPFDNQAQWLDEVLTNNPRTWKIVFFHKPSYTHNVTFDISHESNEEGQNAAYIPIIDKHHVDLVLTSHNHWYERYQPSNCTDQGNPGSDDPCPVADPADGTVHIVSGGAGAFTIPGALCNDFISPPPPGRAVCTGTHHYLLFNVDNENLTMEAWGAAPQANAVYDTLTLTKPPQSCAPIPPDGGAGGVGGTQGTGGFAAGGSGTGNTGTGGTGAEAPPGNSASPEDEAGCGCRTAPPTSSPLAALGLLLGLAAFARRRFS